MPRPTREAPAGMIFHVLNRGNGKQPLFRKPSDFQAFITLLGEALDRFDVDLLAWCLMGNHWHLLLRPRTDSALSSMMGWMTVTHARRHHMHYPKPGSGHIYQGRFKSFPVQSDEHFLTVARYIHANPLRARLVKRAQDWRWSDLGAETSERPQLSGWPLDRPRNWVQIVNEPLAEKEVAEVQSSMRRGAPFGSAEWTKKTASKLRLSSTLRPRGRPTKPLAALSAKYRREKEKAVAEKSG